MSNSSLVSYTNISPNKNSPRNHVIDTITIHCMAGQMTAKNCCDMFSKSSQRTSSNYCIGYDGKIALSVDEGDRSWCTSSSSNDHRAITIEVASDSFAPYKVKDAAYQSLLNLVTDICKRNNIKKLLWKNDKNLIGKVEQQNMTVHCWFANKACPGEYLLNLHDEIAAEVNKRLGASTSTATKPSTTTEATSEIYRVRKTWEDAKTQVGAYKVLENAKACADKNSGYKVFDSKGTVVYEPTTYITYTVVKNDTLWKLAIKYLGRGDRYPEIKKLNNLKSDILYVGQKLKIPKK